MMKEEIKDENGGLLFRVFESFAAARRSAYRTHHHVESELSFIFAGEGSYSVGTAGETYPIAAGDLFFFKNSEPHCITDIAGEGMVLWNIHISPQFLRALDALAGGEGGYGLRFFQQSFARNRLTECLPVEATGAVREGIGRLFAECREKRPGYEGMAKAILAELLILLSRHTAKEKEAFRAGAAGHLEAVYRSAAYIDAHFREPLSLSDLAAAANLEKTYFSTRFKRVIGLSPWEYISIKRVERATDLLRHTDRTVMEIALECGFNSTADFNKIFKKYSNATPSQVRRG